VVFGERCAQAGVTVSMGSVGDCYDNAVCEALHATLKRELVNRRSWPTQAEAQTAVFGYIEGSITPDVGTPRWITAPPQSTNGSPPSSRVDGYRAAW
jgi:hypothetical protein